MPIMIRRAQALFPLKVAGAGCTFNRVEVTAYPEFDSGKKSCACAGKSDEVKHLLGYARHGEGIETIDIAVVVHFDNLDFEEASYGLALAVSDKRARFGPRGGDATIVATGIIGNRGRVSRIEAFAEKLALVHDTQPAGTLFLFPLANRDEAIEGLAALTAKGIDWRAVGAIDELDELWQSDAMTGEADEGASNGRLAGLAVFTKGLALGFLLMLGLVTGIAAVLR